MEKIIVTVLFSSFFIGLLAVIVFALIDILEGKPELFIAVHLLIIIPCLAALIWFFFHIMKIYLKN